MTALALDCEFNGHGGKLISLALVDVHSSINHFYGVVNHYEPTDPWVAQNVIPYLGQPVERRAEFRLRLMHFLQAQNSLTIYADWPADFMYLMQELMTDRHEMTYARAMSMVLLPSIKYVSATPHNALSDAFGIAEAVHAMGFKP